MDVGSTVRSERSRKPAERDARRRHELRLQAPVAAQPAQVGRVIAVSLQ